MSKFLKGTMILLAAGLVTRVLGFINRIVIARFIGEEGVGLYMMAFPTLILTVTITQLGLPVAISKNIAEAEARGDRAKVKKILVVSLATTISLSIIFTPALIFLAPILSETLFTDSRTYLPLLAISPIVPIIAVSSVIRGYFQGRQNMKPAALSQMLEQLVRISLIAAMTKAFLPYGIEYAAAGAMLASVIGELASLVYLLATFKIKKKSGVTVPLILDGVIQETGLGAINQTNFWLRQQLRKRGYTEIQNISFCSYDNGQFYIDFKDEKK